MTPINKWKRVFMCETLTLFLTIKGRINFLQLARYGKYSEQRYRQQFESGFDFMAFNTELVKSHGGGTYIIAIDPSFVSKAGKCTPGIGYFWSGQAGSVKRGLEIVGLAAIDVTNHTGFHLEATQTIVSEKGDATLTQLYSKIIVDREKILKSLSNIVVADAWFSKKPFVDQIADKGFDLISRLRDDASLQYIYNGPKSKKTGRPKKYAGKVNPKALDMDVFSQVKTPDGVVLDTAVVYCKSLQRNIRLVCLPMGKGHKLYFCTNTKLDAVQIFQYYQLRFQIEFLYRDGKQHTGLNHCQARSKNKLYFHTNAALTSINLAKVAHWLPLPLQDRPAFSMNDIKTLNHNLLIIRRVFSKFGINPNTPKNQNYLKELITFGTIAA